NVSTGMPRCSSAATHAAAAPPAPTTAALSASTSSSASASVLAPTIRPSRITSVFTEPARSADSSSSWQYGITLALCGVVTLAPAKPRAARPATASVTAAWWTRSGTYTQSSPRAANAAFCIRGDSDPDTGSPISPTSVVVPSIAFTGAVSVPGTCQAPYDRCRNVKCLDMSDVDSALEVIQAEQEAVLAGLAEERAAAERAAEEQRRWRADVEALLERGRAVGLSVAEMAEALGISRQWTNHLANRAVDKEVKKRAAAFRMGTIELGPPDQPP